jgi:protein-disulfide isomerase
VRDYLIKNPEVLQEAMAELERRQSEGQKAAQASALRDSREALLNSPRDIVAGNASGDVTLVEFFDYNCGYCKRALADVRTLVKADPKLRVVLKDFPSRAGIARSLARVARSQAADQGRKAVRLSLPGHGDPRPGERRARACGRQGNGPRHRENCRRTWRGPEVRAALQENVKLGDQLGLSGTPAFIVGEEIISGAVGVEPLKRTVAGVRQCGKAVC